MRQDQHSDHHRANDGFSAIYCNISGNSNDRQNECRTFKRDLKDFDQPHNRCAYTQCNQFGSYRDPSITEERVT